MKTTRLPLVALTACTFVAACSEAPPPPADQSQWPELLRIALEERPTDGTYAYTLTQKDREDEFSFRIDPSAPDGQKVVLASFSEEANEGDLKAQAKEMQRDFNADISCASFRQFIPTQVAETKRDADIAIYSFNPVPRGRSDRDLFKNLRAQITIDLKTGEVAQLRMVAPEPFNPTPPAHITSFEHTMICQPSPDGRSYQASETTTITGRAGGQSLDQTTEAFVSDLKVVASD